ncbi:hypothetical protein HYC85_005373 [Camellia sinensis]|uniref:Zinc finger PHD-type domain-containing protein n=1 Tax=Camellia sinensis TaxID=4442 RepID=A0A7J7I224_CAMSI|nr:hypothetical protein HYC85_005373 [Camellia sinensis]
MAQQLVDDHLSMAGHLIPWSVASHNAQGAIQRHLQDFHSPQRAYDFSVENFDKRTVMLCDQCEKDYHVGCFCDSGLCDLKVSFRIFVMLSTCIYSVTQYSFSHLVHELPRDKWFCCDDCNRIHVALQNLVLVGAEMIPASVSYAIHRRHVENEFVDGVSNDVQWRILSGKSRYPEHLPVLSSAAAIF